MDKEHLDESSFQEVLRSGRKASKPKAYHFTDLQVEAAKLKAKGFSLSQIAERLGRKPHHISTALKDFRATSERIREVFKELQSVHYWDLQVDRSGFLARGHEAEKHMLREGFWPFSFRKVPKGYMMDEARRLTLDPENVEILSQAFSRVEKAEPPFQVAKKVGLKPASFYDILRNPFYKGYIRFGGEVFQGKHKPLVDEETWNRVQTVIAIKRPSRLRFGFRRTATGVTIEDEEAERIRQVCMLRIERNSMEEITKKVGLPRWLVFEILRSSVYKEIVGANLWEAAHGVHLERGAPVLKKLAEKRKAQTQAKILLHLRNHGPATTSQIAKSNMLGETTVLAHLHRLKMAGLVEREPGWFGKWFLAKRTMSV